jgi:hypothetical protein
MGLLVRATSGLTHSQVGNKSSFLEVRKRNDSPLRYQIAAQCHKATLIDKLIYFFILSKKHLGLLIINHFDIKNTDQNQL